jgi:hypothetical protein
VSDTVRMRKKSDFDFTLERINNPRHYTQGDIECIDAIKASMTQEQFAGFLKGNIQKYLWRYDTKGVYGAEEEEERKSMAYENLGKAEYYLKALMRLYIPKCGVPEYEDVEVSDENT